jgi:hypothetical protein
MNTTNNPNVEAGRRIKGIKQRNKRQKRKIVIEEEDEGRRDRHTQR